MGKAFIYCGDAVQVLQDFEDNQFHTCVTSPPYFGLRDYGVQGQFGLEKSPEEYVQNLVSLFREIKRVLRDDGTVWLNLGDSYAGAGYSKHKNTGGALRKDGGKQRHCINSKLPPKNLIGIPWRVAFALQADGWILRQDIIWHKPNPMPAPVKDRCVTAHEYIFLLAKKPKYYFDYTAIQEKALYAEEHARKATSWGHKKLIGGQKRNTEKYRVLGAGNKACSAGGMRNKRGVWSVTPKGYKEAHFATFPPELITPCILAGAPKGGWVLDPFAGSGTTGMVANQLGRKSCMIDLNPDYIGLQKKRIGKGNYRIM